MKVFITGDCHGDFSRFDNHKFNYTGCSKDNTFIIICGDFGGIFASKPNEPEKDFEQAKLDSLANKPATFIIVGGNHENYDAIETNYPISEFHAAKARYIRDNVVWIERGYSFVLKGKIFWCFGGAYSVDKAYRVAGESWWSREEADDNEMRFGLGMLDIKPDYVITHDAPGSICSVLYPNYSTHLQSETEKYLDRVRWELSMMDINPTWYFGHHHCDWQFENFNCTYGRIKRIDL